MAKRLKATRPARPWVEPEQLMAFLESSSGVGRVLLAVLAGAGLRIGEALSLKSAERRPRDRPLYVVDAKTRRASARFTSPPRCARNSRYGALRQSTRRRRTS